MLVAWGRSIPVEQPGQPFELAFPAGRFLVLRFRGVVFSRDGVDLLQDLRPSFAHALERKIVRRRAEAGMHQAKSGAAIDLGDRPRDDGLESRAVPHIFLTSA